MNRKMKIEKQANLLRSDVLAIKQDRKNNNLLSLNMKILAKTRKKYFSDVSVSRAIQLTF